MAHAHFASIVHKSGERKAAGRVQYITRTGPYEHTTGAGARREDLVCWEARNLPAWASDHPSRYFSAAERYERVNGVAYTEWRFALPRELTRAEQLAATQALLQASFGATHPYVWAFHCPAAADGQPQPHIHVLWSSRTLDSYERSPAHFFRRYNRTHPARGGAEKNPTLYHFGAVKAARVLYTDIMNLYLERGRNDGRLHPDSLSMRGMLREVEPRIFPSDFNALKKHGAITERTQKVLAHRTLHAAEKVVEQAQAQDYWQERQDTLGITEAMSLAERLAQVCEARGERGREAPMRQERPTPAASHEAGLPVLLIGNRRSKIYHAPGDPNYGDVHPNSQVTFWSVAEAEEAGFRRAQNQHYGVGAFAPMSQLEAEIRALDQHLTQLAGARTQLAYYEQGGRPLPEPLAERIHRLINEEWVMPAALEERFAGRAARAEIWDERQYRDERRATDERA